MDSNVLKITAAVHFFNFESTTKITVFMLQKWDVLFALLRMHIWVNFTVGDDQRLEMSRKRAGVCCYKTITRHAGNLKRSGIVKHHQGTKWCIF